MEKFNLDYIRDKKNGELFPFYKHEYWHSGIHINDSSLEIYLPVSCKIEACKLEENEFITELPEKIIAPQIELGPKIKILNEEEKNTLELYNIPEDSEIPLYELIDSEKGKKIEVGSTNYLLLKYEDLSNNLMFYLLFSHLDPYKRYLTKGDEDNWISLKSFKDWLQVPFYINWKLKIDTGCQSSSYVFKDKYPPKVTFISKDETFFKKEFDLNNSDIEVIFNGDNESESLKVNIQYLNVEDNFNLIRKEAAKLMLYKKDGEIYVPQYVIDDKGIKLAYSISDNKDNKSEYRLIQIPEWEGSKETPDERKIYRIGFIPKDYLNKNEVKRSCFLRYPIICNNEKSDICRLVTEEETKENNIQINETSKIGDKYLVISDNYQIYPTGLKPVNFLLPTRDVFFNILSTDENDPYFHKVALQQMSIYISLEDITEENVDDITEYTVNTDLKNPIYLVDSKYPINFYGCISRLAEKDYKDELNLLKTNYFGTNGENLKGKKIEYDNFVEKVKVLQPSESDITKEISVEKEYKRFVIKNINPNYCFYIHEKELKNKEIDEINGVCKFSAKNSKPFLIEIYEKPLEEKEYLFVKDNKIIIPIKVSKTIYDKLEKNPVEDIEIYCMEKSYCLCKGVNNVEDLNFNKEYAEKDLWNKINSLPEIKSVQVKCQNINGKAYVKENEVELINNEQDLPHGILNEPILPLTVENSDWKLNNKIAIKYEKNDVTSKFLGFINLSSVNEINCDTSNIKIEGKFISTSTDSIQYSIYFDNQDDLDKCYISNFFNEDKIKKGLEITPADFIGHTGNFLGEKGFFHISLFMKEKLKNIKTSYFMLDDSVKYFDYGLRENAELDGKVVIPSRETVFQIIDRYADFYKVKLESLHIFIHEKDEEKFGKKGITDDYVINDSSLTKKLIYIGPSNYFYVYDKALKMRYEQDRYISNKINLVFDSPKDNNDGNLAKDYNSFKEGLMTLGNNFFCDLEILSLKDDKYIDSPNNQYKRYKVSKIQNNWSFWIDNNELQATELNNKLTVTLSAPKLINIYKTPKIYERYEINIAAVDSSFKRKSFTKFLRYGVEEKVRFGPLVEKREVQNYKFLFSNGKYVYVDKTECENKLKRTEIKWDDLFHCFETKDTKLKVSNNTKAKIAEYVNDEEERIKILCSFPFEYNSDLYTKDNYSDPLPEEQFNFYKSIFDNMAFKDLDIFKSEIDIKNVFFANPMFFLNTCDMLGMFEFNPYELNKNNSKLHVSASYKTSPKGVKYGSPGGTEVLNKSSLFNNPGCAPFVMKNGEEEYAALTGVFNEDYLKVARYMNNGEPDLYSNYRTKYHHFGVDFSAKKGTPVKSFIYGKVIAKGWISTNGRCLLIQRKSNNYLYLLCHLSGYPDNIKVGTDISPGEVIAFTGCSGVSKDGCSESTFEGAPHLHLSVLKYDKDAKLVNLLIKDSKTGTTEDTYSWRGKYTPSYVDPFDYKKSWIGSEDIK